VFPRGLKSNIAINMAGVLLLGMVLIDFVTISTAQRDFFGNEKAKGFLLIAALEDRLVNQLGYKNEVRETIYPHSLEAILDKAEFSCAAVLDENYKQVYVGGTDCSLQDELKNLAEQTIQSDQEITKSFGSAWGVFWKQSRTMVLAAPLRGGSVILGGIAVAVPLEGIYKTLRRSQKILFIYILINTAIFTLIGLYRLSKIYFEPMQRLVKRADEYRENEDLLFTVRREDNELHQLSKALNRMLQRISEDKKKLRSTVQSLEKTNIELKQAQKEIIQAEKLASVGRLSSGIAHEIGNPIGIIIGYLELLKQKNITADEKSEYIARTEDEINRINTIIRQLLDLSGPSNDGAQPVSVHEIINDITEVIRSQPLMSNIRIYQFLEAKDDTVIADASQLRQVFLNLIINATDAISSGPKDTKGELTIKSTIRPETSDSDKKAVKVQPMLQIEYIDNGPGISPENLDNIFDPFFTTKEPGKGTGLGLSVSFMIVESIGGTLKAASEKGKGTTMIILLPLATASVTEERKIGS
jgi:two-component system NtrC family sensor kinase